MSEQARIKPPGPGIILPLVPKRPGPVTRISPTEATSAAAQLADAIEVGTIPDCPTCGAVYHEHPFKPGQRIRVLCSHQYAEVELAEKEAERLARFHALAQKHEKTLPARAHRGARMRSVDDRPAKARAKAAALRYLDTWDARRVEGSGLMFIGDKGTGKSYLAAAIAGELEARGWFGTFVAVADLPGIYRDKLRRDAFPAMVAASDFVVLDDLGTDEPTPWDAANLEGLVDLCFRTRKPLLVTANLGADGIREHYARCLASWGVGADDADIKIGRTISRLKDCCKVFGFIGEDQRGEGRHSWADDL